MRLLHLENGKFVFTDASYDPPPYAILSHTWAIDGSKEVIYQDVLEDRAQEKDGYRKLVFCADQVRRDGLEYFWIDTCCIDKRNEPEIAMSIRSMYRWYTNSARCYVYLEDVVAGDAWQESFRRCRWLTRGWTLQELLAPTSVEFYIPGQHLGSRNDLLDLIRESTGIDAGAIQGKIQEYPHHARLHWANGRETKVPEDMSYALMGLCGISMSARYGEGAEEARRRLESKIRQQFGTVALDTRSLHAEHRSGSGPDLIARRDMLLNLLQFEVMDLRRDTIKKAWSVTCAWVLEHPAYKSWRRAEGQDHGFFWIKGKPGAGKSVLIKFLDNHISSTKTTSDVLISFYFNARGVSLEKTFAGLYRSLLAQLLLAVPALKSVLDNARLGALDDSERTLTELRRLFLDAVCKLGNRRLFVLADALDECGEQDVQRLINYMQEVAETARDQGVLVFSCFASRHYPIVDIPTRLHLTLENVDEHAADLSTYVQSHIRVGTARQAEAIEQQILEKAQGVFLWVVLVVEILNAVFRNGQIHAVQERLTSIPQDLTQLINDIIYRDDGNLANFLLCVRWIYYARRPLDLTEFYFAMMANTPGCELKWDPEEVTFAQMHAFMLSSSKGLAELTRGKQRVQFIHEAVRDYFVSSGLLLEHAEQSIADSEAAAHIMLERCCLRGCKDDVNQKCQYSRIDFLGQDFPYQTSSLEGLAFPFSRYAVVFLFQHAELAAARNVTSIKLLDGLDLDHWRRQSNLLDSGIETYNGGLTLPYVCADMNLPRLLMRCDNTDSFGLVKCGSQQYSTPLFAAFALGHKAVATVLLYRTSAEDYQGILNEAFNARLQGSWQSVGGVNGWSERPWVRALQLKCGLLASHLLDLLSSQEIVDEIQQDYHAKSALHVAIANNLLEASKTIVAACDQHGQGSLVDEILQRELIQAIHKNNPTPINTIMALRPHLQTASAAVLAIKDDRHEALAALLDKSASLAGWRDTAGETLLHLTQCPECIQLLVVYCDVNARANDRRSPLEMAIDHNACLATIHFLLQAGATRRTDGHLHQRIIQLTDTVFPNGSLQPVKQQQPDLALPYLFAPPLFVAINLGHERLVSDLLQAGAGQEVRLSEAHPIPLPAHLTQAGVQYDSVEHCALSWAASGTSDMMLPLLLKHGATPNHEDDHRLRPLHYAAMSLHPHRVAMLLHAGASPFVEDKMHRKPLDFVEQSAMLIEAGIFAVDAEEQLPSRIAACRKLLAKFRA